MTRRIAAGVFLLLALPLAGQSQWELTHRFDIRGNFRNSQDARFRLRAPFPPSFIPAGQDGVFLQTVDPGTHAELSVAAVELNANYGDFIGARARVHVVDKYRRNPTSSDRKVDADELFVRFGRKPEFLERPPGTSFFLQIGKAPKMERQPTRLLESYGLAATAFNRFEDVQALVGGTVGRNFYWRLQLANGNPLFFRDPHALAGDNGTPDRMPPNPTPELNSGFPILYNAEVEELFFNSSNLQLGQGLGYRWQRADENLGFDLIVFHYRRSLAESKDLQGTFYNGDLELLRGAFGISLPIDPADRTKAEYGTRLYGEWHGLTSILQFTKQRIAGLQRQGYEAEVGYRIPVRLGPVEYVQPAARLSGITNRFRGERTFVAPSVWWPWTKIDGGVRIGFPRGVDLTLEYARQNIGAPVKLKVNETLVTVRVRM